MIKSYPQVKSICIYLSLDKVWNCGGPTGVPLASSGTNSSSSPIYDFRFTLLYCT